MQHVSSWFQSAVLPRRWRIAGVSCGALSVWHHYALSNLGNAYVCGMGTDRDDATGLLALCSRDYAAGAAVFQFPADLAKMIRKTARVVEKTPWKALDAACYDYVATCCRVPQHTEPPIHVGPGGKVLPSTSKKCASPLHWALVSFLCQGRPDLLEAAWNTPYATARCLFDSTRDVEGKTETLESEEEEQRIDAWLEKQRAEKENGGAA